MGLTDNPNPYHYGFNIDKTKTLNAASIEGKYMIMERVSASDENLSNVNPFLIKKVIDNVCSEVEMCKKLRNGKILIKTKTLVQAQKLVQLVSLSANIQVTVSEHKTLNATKGVIYCNDLRGMKEEVILNELKLQHVIKVEKILKKADNNLVETGLIILTFDKMSLPDHIMVGYEKIRVNIFIPRPMRCSKCCQYGHSQKFCKNTQTCGICSKAFHTNTELGEKCSNANQCVNCNLHNLSPQNHTIFDKSCPVFMKEKEIQAIITLEKTNRSSAIAIYNQRNPNNKISYAKVTASAVSPEPSSNSSNNKNPTSTAKIITQNSRRPTIDYSDLILANNNSLTSAKAKRNQSVNILPRNRSIRTRSKLKKIVSSSDVKAKKTDNSEDFFEDNMDLDIDNIN